MENQFLIDSEYLSAEALEKKHRLETDPSSSYLLPVSAQVIKKIQDGKTDCIYIKNTYELGYESIQMLDTYSRNKYMKDISIPCHKVDKAAIESGELDALLTN